MTFAKVSVRILVIQQLNLFSFAKVSIEEMHQPKGSIDKTQMLMGRIKL